MRYRVTCYRACDNGACDDLDSPEPGVTYATEAEAMERAEWWAGQETDPEIEYDTDEALS